MKKKKRDLRNLRSETQEYIRYQAVKAVRSGKDPAEVATLYDTTETSVDIWVKKAEQGSLKSLKSKPRGRRKGQGRKLTNNRCATIVKLITDKFPDQLKLPFCLWTREAVRDLIEQRYGVRYSLVHVGRLLKKWGLTSQKPAKQALEQSSEAVEKWKTEEYPALQEKAKKEKAIVLWGDEMGARSDAAPGKTYARKGKTPVLRRTGKRFGGNVISAITNQGKLYFMVFKKHFNALIFLRFLERLIKQIKRKIILIVDNHPVHKKSKAVQSFLEDNKDRIELAFLPTYSPELNPDELLNQDLKTNAVRRKRAQSQKEMMTNLRSYLYKRQKQPQIVKNYFKAKQVQYAA